MNGGQGSQLASGHSKHKGRSQRCQVCLKFILPLVRQYLGDGQYCGKVYSASNVFLSGWLEMKGRWDGREAAFVLGVNNQLARIFFSSFLHVRRAGSTGGLRTSPAFLLLHKNVSPS